jgi:hypothetical protein
VETAGSQERHRMLQRMLKTIQAIGILGGGVMLALLVCCSAPSLLGSMGASHEGPAVVIETLVKDVCQWCQALLTQRRPFQQPSAQEAP